MSSIVIRPRNTAVYRAVRSPGGAEAAEVVRDLIQTYGWEVDERATTPTDKTYLLLTRTARQPKRVFKGDWVILLNTNGSLRVLPDHEFRATYEEVPPGA